MAHAPEPRIYEFGDFRIDGDHRMLYHQGSEIPLVPKAVETLLALVDRRGKIVSKDELLQAVWPDTVVEEANLFVYLSVLRKTLGTLQDGRPYVETLRRRGYRFNGDVHLVAQAVEDKREEVSNVITTARARSTWTRYRLILLSGVIIAALGVMTFYLWRVRTKAAAPTRVRSVAVLPFKPLVAENRDEALESGMAEDLITRLGNIKGLKVVPLTSVRRYGGMEQDPLAAGRELQVDAVLDGSIQRSGDHIRVTARLVTVDGEQLWAKPFDEKFTDVMVVQQAISERVVDALALHLSGDEDRRLKKRYTDKPAANELYMKGRYNVSKLTPAEIEKGIEFYEEAVKVDPTYALAYTGIAYAYLSLPITSDVAPKDVFPKAKEAVTKALDLDDSLSEAHTCLGQIKFWFDWDWAGSEKEFRRAIDLNPNNADAHRGYAQLLSNTGRDNEALEQAERARQLDPVSLITSTLEAQFMHFAGHDDEALLRFKKTFDELGSNFWVTHVNFAYVLIHQKRYAEALTELAKAKEQSGGNTQAISLRGYVLALSGERNQARAVLEELRKLSEQRYVPPYNLAVVHHGLGEREQALTWLEKAFEERDVMMTFLAVDRKWEALRGDQRFLSLLERMTLRK